MARVRSAKGEIVDFDLLKIRQKLAEKPVSVDVKAREDFIDKKLRRRIRKAKQAAATGQTGAIVDSEILSGVETSAETKLIDPPKAKKVDKKETKSQKHRPPSK